MRSVGGDRSVTRGRKRFALILDDDPPSLRSFQRVLARHDDLEVLSATKISEAFGLVTMLEPTPQPIVAFVDVLMPGMDGPRFVQGLRSIRAFGAAPIVLVSGLSERALERTAINWGASGFVLKTRGLINLDREFAGWVERITLPPSSGPLSGPPSGPLSRR